jgi:hypothetical protein
VTRYTALYTSLAKTYKVFFDNPDSLAQPFGTATDFERSAYDTVHEATLRRERKLSLRGFHVPSNKIGFVHSEQMSGLGGKIELLGDESVGYRVLNGTDFSLHDVGVMRRTEEGVMQTAWIGDLESGSAKQVPWRTGGGGERHLPQWDASPTTLSYETQAQEVLDRLDTNQDGRLQWREVMNDGPISRQFARIDAQFDRRNTERGEGIWEQDELIEWCRMSRAGELSLGQLIALASRGLDFGLGETRLIGWTDQEFPGTEVVPAAAQTVHRTMFLVHLNRGQFPAAHPDVNRRADFVRQMPRAVLEAEDSAVGTQGANNP